MCGRNSLYVNGKTLKERYSASLDIEWSKSYNIAPGNSQPVVKKNSPKTLERMKWNFIPSFAKSEKEKRKWRKRSLINARIETVEDKNTFKKSFQERKCLIPSTGFYEWKDEGNPRKTPYHIQPGKGRIFSMAGFYNDGTFVILTKDSENSEMSEIHDRTPVILEQSMEDPYLNGEVSRKELEDSSYDNLEIEQVSRKVNNPENDSKDVLKLDSRQSSFRDM
ncbi:MAG: SOS response-associated peptidase [Candidatus Nanohaloarchaea archaeon]